MRLCLAVISTVAAHEKLEASDMTIDPMSVTVEEFAAWVRKQNPNKTYNYTHHRDCAFAQYLQHLGCEAPSIACDNTPKAIEEAVINPRGSPDHRLEGPALWRTWGWTFGELLERLEAIEIIRGKTR